MITKADSVFAYWTFTKFTQFAVWLYYRNRVWG